MSESSPEIQPSLPIFGAEETAWYSINPNIGGAEHNATTETVHVPLDEIDQMSDPRMRQALWSQVRYRMANPRIKAVFVTANPDNTHYATTYASRGGLNPPSMERISIDSEHDATSVFPERVLEKKTAARRMVERFFS